MKFPQNTNLKGATFSGSRAIGLGTNRSTTTSGSAAYGETHRRNDAGCQGIGIRPTLATVGFPATGLKKSNKKLATFLSRLFQSTKAHRPLHRTNNIFTFPGTGSSKMITIAGPQDTGRQWSKTGFGSRQATYGRHVVASFSQDIGTMKLTNAEPVSLRCTSTVQFITRPTISISLHLQST